MTSSAEIDCSHRPTCPGCPHFAVPGIAGAAFERLERLAASHGATLLQPAAPSLDVAMAFGHRHRARLMVRGRSASPKIGIFQASSHKIADIPRCHVHHPTINCVAALLKEAIRATGAEPYADAPHRGCVRALQVVVERVGERADTPVGEEPSCAAQVVVVSNDESIERARPLLVDFEARLRAAGLLHSLWWNANPQRTNTILGARFELVATRGPGDSGWICESIGGALVFFPPAAFGQSHLRLADDLVARVQAFVGGAESVAECYAGCGSIGLGLLARGARVAFNEQNPAGIAGLERGIEALGAGARARVCVGAAGDCLEVLDGVDVAIVDPPRKGLDEALLRALAAGAVPRLAYVSCGLESLERDVAGLLEAGRLRLRSLEPFALFPFTEHVETLALFERL